MITLLPFLRPKWNPLKLSGLSLWLDANDASSVLNSVGPDLAAGSGQTVRCWKDLSGNGRHLEQTTGSAQPTVQSNWRNGLRALFFDGSNDHLTTSNPPIPYNSGAEFTILLAAEFISSGGGVVAQGNLSAGTSVNDPLVWWRSGNTTNVIVGNGATANQALINSDTGAAIRSSRFNASNLIIRKNGATLASVARTVTDPANVDIFGVGRWFNYSQMRVAELLIYNRGLSDSEMVTGEAYLTKKYAT